MADEQTDTPAPAVTRVLQALTDRLHESLCNCRKYPAECASRTDYRRDDLVHTFGHAEEALEEALQQGWTPAAAVTPPVAGETTESAVESAVQIGIGTIDWDAYPDPPTGGQPAAEAADEAIRAAIAAYLPHLTAERDAARNEYVAIGVTLDHVTDRLSDMVDDAGLARPESLADTLDAVSTLITERDAETTALRAELDAERAESLRLRALAVDRLAYTGRVEEALRDTRADRDEALAAVHRMARTALDIQRNPNGPLPVLADPAPSTPAAQENQT